MKWFYVFMASNEPALNTGFSSGTTTSDASLVPTIVPSKDNMTALGQYITNAFTENSDHRRLSGVDGKLLNSLRACKSEYSPKERAILAEFGISEDIFTPITDTKRRAAHSQISEIFNSPSDQPWVIKASPLPEVPESVAKEAFQEIIAGFIEICEATKQIPSPEAVYKYAESRMDEVFRREVEWAGIRAARMEVKVQDQMVEGGWLRAFPDYCNYLCTYGTAVVKGPVARVVLQPEVKETSVGTYKYALKRKEILCYEAVNPWDCYPSKGAKTIDEGNICIRVRFKTDDLWRFSSEKAKSNTTSGDKGEWFADTIRALLTIYPNGGISIQGQPYDLIRQQLENDGSDSANKCILEGIEFFGNVRGSILQSLGIETTQEGDFIENDNYYEVDAIEIDGYVIYCKVINPCVGRPLSKGVFYESVDSWWGDSIAEKLKSTQKVMNSSLRNMVMNMAMTSGPMFFIKDASRLVDKSPDACQLKPWKMFQFNTGQMGQTDIPIGVLDVQSKVSEALNIFEWAKKQADEDSGIPAYTYGTNVSGGAGRTASGLAMLTEAANRGMKTVITATDRDVIRDIVKRTVRYNLVYDDDVSIKGDCEVNPAGVMGKILRENESQGRKQLLNIMLNPVIYQIVGPKAIMAILREEIKTSGIANIDDVLPSKEKLEELEMLEQLKQLTQATNQQAEGDAIRQDTANGEQEMTQGQVAQRDVQQNPQAVAARGDPSMRVEPQGQVAERRGVA